MIDVTHQIESVERHVGTRHLEAGEARTVTISQTYDTDVDDLWDAVTNIERIPRWFLPITGDLRVGGKYQFEGQAGGTIETCDPPRTFSATWEYGGEVSWIEVTLTPEPGGRTRFELQHIASVDDARWLEFGPGAVGVGWDSAVMGLAIHMATKREVDRAEVEKWMASPDAPRFMTLSSERWRDASVAAGTDLEEASRAADRTTAAYTGAEMPEEG